MPFPPFAAAVAAATLLAAACAARGGALPSPAGVAASAGSSAGEATPAGGAAPAGWRPCGRRRLRGRFCPLGSARRRCCLAGGRPCGVFARGSSGHRRRCPAVPQPALLPRDASARGLSGSRRLLQADRRPAAAGTALAHAPALCCLAATAAAAAGGCRHADRG